MEKPPEPKLELDFHLPIKLRQELMHLWTQCLITRDRGIEHRMDHGRALADLRDWFQQFPAEKRDHGFAAACEGLETTQDEARRRINMARTWDEIREYIEEHGLPTPMPRNENHLISLFPRELPERGEAWVKIYGEATSEGIEVTSRYITEWIKSAKALPVPSEVMSVTDNELTLGEDEIEQDETAKEETAEEEQPPPGKQEEKAPPKRTSFKRPPELDAAVDRIVRICGGEEEEKQQGWREALADPVKIKFEDLLLWEHHDDEDIRRIGQLIVGDFGVGLRRAIRIVDRVIDRRTSLDQMISRCIAEGGRWEHTEGQFRVTITHMTRMKDTT